MVGGWMDRRRSTMRVLLASSSSTTIMTPRAFKKRSSIHFFRDRSAVVPFSLETDREGERAAIQSEESYRIVRAVEGEYNKHLVYCSPTFPY